MHHRDQHGLRPHRPPNRIRIDPPTAIDIHIRDRNARFLQRLASIQHRFMLDRRRNNVRRRSRLESVWILHRNLIGRAS